MARMTRTQITLEEDEYLFLKSEAAHRGSSLSSVVRDLVRERMGLLPRGPLHVWELAGILEGAKYIDTTGEDFDDMLLDAVAPECSPRRDESQ
jgi:hypothetical protein